MDETAHLKETVAAMREAMENMRAAERSNIQQDLADANGEIVQLRATVQAMRDQLHAQQADAHDEIRQLQLTIADLRTRLEQAL